MKDNIKRKFDTVIMNPPYQADQNATGKRGGGHSLWDKFVELSFSLAKEDGYIASIHPSRWRKPDDKLGKVMRDKEFLFLRIFNKKQGEAIFGAITRVDWYVLKNCKHSDDYAKSSDDYAVEIIWENSEKTSMSIKDFSALPFIPNFDISLLLNILAKDKEHCEVMYDRSAYGTHKSHISKEKTSEFKYPCVSNTGVKGVRYYWSSTKENGFFGVPKVIFGDADTINNAVVDMAGEYSMTQHAFAIPIVSDSEGQQIKKALESKKFNDFLKACRWSNFQIDHRMFKYFRKDFWKEFE